jgi:hypothetical protein
LNRFLVNHHFITYSGKICQLLAYLLLPQDIGFDPAILLLKN